MALRASPLGFQYTLKPPYPVPTVYSPRFARVFMPTIPKSSTNVALCIPNSQGHSWRSKVKSEEAEGHPSIEGMLLDEQTLQRNLDKAIEEEDYTRAAKLRDDLHLLHEDNKASILAANSRFYNAFRNGDFKVMQSTWAKGENVYVVHPGAGRISGYELVMRSWEIVCGAEHEFPLQIDLKNVEVHVKGDVGYVTCLEVVKTKGSSWGKQIATNVFEKVGGRWYICVHHASHIDL